MEPLDRIIAFVEGRASLEAFLRAVNEDPGLQAVLEEDVVIRPYTNAGNLLLYIVAQDPSSLSAHVGIQDALSKFLQLRGRDHVADAAAADLFDLILRQTPKWIALPEFFMQRLCDRIRGNPDRKGAAAWVRQEIAASFRCLEKPPGWLQSPAWICIGERPLVFVGQMQLGDLLHDEAQVFVFFDEATREIRTVVQAA